MQLKYQEELRRDIIIIIIIIHHVYYQLLLKKAGGDEKVSRGDQVFLVLQWLHGQFPSVHHL